MKNAILLLLLVAGCRSVALSTGTGDAEDGGGVSDASTVDGAVVCTSQTEDPAVCAAQPGCKQFECPGCGGQFLFCAAATSSHKVCPLLNCPIELDCKTLPQIIESQVNGDNYCMTDEDCALVTTACGLAGQCGAYVHKGDESSIQSDVDEWTALGCGKGCMPPPCATPLAPHCLNGQCE